VLAHRLLPSVEASMGGHTTAEILGRVLAGVAVPEGHRS
jgi:MoxR-like ATPase